MKKTSVFAACLSLAILLCPVTGFAGSNSLPEFKLPELKPLERPTLSKNYSDMLKELEAQGWGKYKYNPQEKLPLPEVEPPKGAGRDATDKFKEEFGDMWNSPDHQLDKKSMIPEDAYFKNFLENYKAEKLKNFQDAKGADSMTMKDFLKKQLDMSQLWNFEALKKQIQFKDTAGFLAGLPKPTGWDSTKSSASSVPSSDSWLKGGPKAEGYGHSSALDAVDDSLKPIFPGLNLKDKLLDGINKAKEAVDNAVKKAKEEKAKNGSVSESTLKELKERAIQESRQFIPFFHGK